MSPQRMAGMRMSPETAETVAFWSNWFFLASLVIGIIATFLLIVSGGVKEANLKRELANSREKTAALELEVVRAKQRLQKESHERLMLQMQLSPRVLSAVALESLGDAVRAFSGDSVAIETYVHDAEAANLAGQLIDCLRAGGLQVSDEIASRHETGRLAVGVIVGGRNESLAKLIAATLASAAHLDVAYDPEQSDKQDQSAPGVLILVGVRPVPKIDNPLDLP